MSEYNIHNLKVGDKVIVNEYLLRKWTTKENWGDGMFDLFNKELTIRKINVFGRPDTYRVHVEESDWWIPIQCLEPFEKDDTISVRWYKKGKLEK